MYPEKWDHVDSIPLPGEPLPVMAATNEAFDDGFDGISSIPAQPDVSEAFHDVLPTDEPASVVANAELARHATEGDSTALTQLFVNVYPALKGFLQRRGDPTPEDTLQITYLKAAAAIGTARPDNLVAWLYRIASNSHIDQHRAERKSTLLPPDDEAFTQQSAAADPEGEALVAQQLATVRAHLETYDKGAPDNKKMRLLDLFDHVLWGGMSYQDYADQQGIPVGTVRTRVSRLRQHCRNLRDQGLL